MQFFVKNVSDTEVTYTLSYDLISDAVVGDATEDRSDDALAGYARNLSGNVSFRDSDGMEIKTVTVPAGAEGSSRSVRIAQQSGHGLYGSLF